MHICSLKPNYRVPNTVGELTARHVRPIRTHSRNQRVIRATLNEGEHWMQASAVKITAAVASALILSASAPLLISPPPAHADIQTVSADELINSAKPIRITQKINKGRIWLLIILGASSLFSTTVVLENNESWFPAISRANKAMRATSKKNRKTDDSIIIESDNNNNMPMVMENQQEEDEDSKRLQAAVLEGMASARQRVIAVDSNNSNKIDEDEYTKPDALITNWGSDMSDADEVDMGMSDTDGIVVNNEEEEEQEEREQEVRKPLFEISSEQIEESLKRKKLEQLSLEDLQNELLARQSSSSSSGEK